jgi:predicted ABC-type transport system involved in lysophospholipase L1 biosynthesis ATPase subunit
MAALIELENVQKVYRTGDVEVHALRGVSLTLRRGEFVALVGASGSGKSTLMNVLGCLDTPTSGTYPFDGQDVGRLSRTERARLRNDKLVFVFQGFNLLQRYSALENVLEPLLDGGKALVGRQDPLALGDQRAGDRLDFRPDPGGLLHNRGWAFGQRGRPRPGAGFARAAFASRWRSVSRMMSAHSVTDSLEVLRTRS